MCSVCAGERNDMDGGQKSYGTPRENRSRLVASDFS